MKKYVCDICEEVIDNPYSCKKIEFYIGTKFELKYVFPENCKESRRIHVCPRCGEEFVAFVKEKRTKQQV